MKGEVSLNNNILFGMPTLIECKSIEENIALCEELGLSFIELNMNLPQFQLHNIDCDYYRYLMKSNHIFFTLHLPEDLNISNFNPVVANAYMRTVKDSIKISKKLDISIINMHMSTGIYFTLPDSKVYLFDEYLDFYIESIKAFGKMLSQNISDNNISICIENTGIFDKDFINEAVEELLKYDFCKLTWDIGHDHSSGNLDFGFITTHIQNIKHFHIHDAIGKDNHLPLGSGEIDILEKLNIAEKYNCSCVIETKTIEGLRKSVAFLRQVGIS
jgi:sugar phosphate isomerase/epimerase